MGITVRELIELPFSCRSVEEKVLIVADGKPVPIIDLSLFQGTSNQPGMPNQLIDHSVYAHFAWVTACERSGYFFCWPCLLAGGKDPVWRTYSSHIPAQVIEMHERQPRHLVAEQFLKSFEAEHARKARQEPAGSRYKQLCHRNPEVLRMLVDVVCELARTTPLRRITETNNRVSVDACVRLLRLVHKSCNRSSKFTDEAIALVRSSPKLVDDLAEAIKKGLEAKVKSELQSSSFVSLIVSEHSVDPSASHLSLVARYIRDGRVCERLLGFLSILVDKSRDVLYNILMAMIERFGIAGKVISCSVGGGILEADQLPELRKMILRTQPNFCLVPSHYHDLYSLLQQVMLPHKRVGHFFKALSAAGAFFDPRSRHWMNFEDFVLRRGRPGDSPEHLRTTPLATLVHRHRQDCIDFLDHTCQGGSNLCSPADVIQARGFVEFLSEFETAFFLRAVSELFQLPTMTFIDRTMRSPDPELDFDKMAEVSYNFTQLENAVLDFEDLWDRTVAEIVDAPVLDGVLKAEFKEAFDEMVLTFQEEVKARYLDLGRLEFMCMLQKEYYASSGSVTNFPRKTLSAYFGILQRSHFNFLELEQLKNEIQVLRETSTLLDNEGVFSVLEVLSDSSRDKVFHQLLKLFEFSLTMPFRPPRDGGGKSQQIKKLEVSGVIPPGETSVLVIEGDYLQRLSNDVFFYKNVTTQFFESA